MLYLDLGADSSDISYKKDISLASFIKNFS